MSWRLGSIGASRSVWFCAIVSAIAVAAFLAIGAERAEAAPANDDFSGAVPLASEVPAVEFGVSTEATEQAGEPNHAGEPGGASVWYSWTPSISGPVAVGTCAPGFDAVVAVYTGSSVNALTEVGSNADDPAGPCAATDGLVRVNVVAGTTYRIAVDGEGGESGSFIISVLGPPANDRFDEAQSAGEALSFSVSGHNAVASKEAGEPNHGGNAGGRSVWLEWTPFVGGKVKISVCSGTDGFDPLLGIYTGTAVNALSTVAGDDNSAGAECSTPNGSAVTVEVTAGTKYMIAIDGKGPSEGSFALTATEIPNDDFANAMPIDQLPAGFSDDNEAATKQTGEPSHAGNAGGASVWYRWTAGSAGKVTISTCTFGGLDTLLAVYTGSAVNALTPVVSNDDSGAGCEATDSRVEFTASAGTTYRIAVDGKGGDTGFFSFDMLGPPVNDAFAGAKVVDPSRPRMSSGATNGRARRPESPTTRATPADTRSGTRGHRRSAAKSSFPPARPSSTKWTPCSACTRAPRRGA